MRWSLRVLGLACVVLLPASFAGSADESVPASIERERAGILAHGPWPATAAHDRSNRVDGAAAAVAFGRRMFHEPRLSANGYVACVTCHQTNRAFTDAIARARGLAPVERNTPTLTNVALYEAFGWSGSSDSLWLASLRPILDEREMGVNAAAVAHVVRIGDGLACEYERAFGRAPQAVDDEQVLVDVAKALAAFVGTLRTGRTAFDEYRDALARGDWAQAVRYPAAAARGARLFDGAAGCGTCHRGANFSDGSFHAVNDAAGPTASAPVEEVMHLQRYRRGGPFDDGGAGSAPATAVASGRYRVPSLRNVAVTPPYLHDGSAATLRDAVQHGAVALSTAETADLVAFLETLTDAAGAQRPSQRPGDSTCR